MSTLPRDPTAALLARLNRNINALGSAIDEIRIWIEQRGSTQKSDSIRSYLAVLEDNASFISEGMDDLILICAKRGNDGPNGGSER